MSTTTGNTDKQEKTKRIGRLLWLAALMQITATTTAGAAAQHPDEDGRCVPLSSSICSDMHYNFTLMPNGVMNVDSMEEATTRISEFKPLFHVGCFRNFKFFICNMFLPICHVLNKRPTPVYPCRHVCEQARRGCEPLMQRYSFQWPAVLNCDRLADHHDPDPMRVCGSPPEHESTPQPPLTQPPDTASLPAAPSWVAPLERFSDPAAWFRAHENGPMNGSATVMFPNLSMRTFCLQSDKFVYLRGGAAGHTTAEKPSELCLPKCAADVEFSATDKRFASVWLTTWSIICLMSTTVTVCTFLIDHRRFRYPERPIIFLSFCYQLYAVGHLVRVFVGYRGVVCERAATASEYHVTRDGMHVTSCTLVFFFAYFFGMASALWWVVLSVTWFLSAARKWGHEAIERYASLFHTVAWAVPTVQTLLALVLRKVSVDRLSGLCFIGHRNPEDLMYFVIVPLTTYLAIGTFFLCLGFCSLARIRHHLRLRRNTDKLERLMVRIGIFSVLYSVPASVVLACFIHEYMRMRALQRLQRNLVGCLATPHCGSTVAPRVELFFLRYFMMLVVGVTSSVWLWSSKTLHSWRNFYRRLCGQAPQPHAVNGAAKHERDEKRRLCNEQVNGTAAAGVERPSVHEQTLTAFMKQSTAVATNNRQPPPSNKTSSNGDANRNMMPINGVQQIYAPPTSAAAFFFPLAVPQANGATFAAAPVMDEFSRFSAAAAAAPTSGRSTVTSSSSSNPSSKNFSARAHTPSAIIANGKITSQNAHARANSNFSRSGQSDSDGSCFKSSSHHSRSSNNGKDVLM